MFDNTFDCTIITSNKDYYNKKLKKADYIKGVNYVNRVGVLKLISLLKNSKIIWINSLYSIPFGFLSLISLFFLKKKIVLISPRGQLLKGAISSRKIKYLTLYKILLKLTRHSIIIHYTHENEKNDSFPIFKGYNSVIFPNPINENLMEVNNFEKRNKNFVIGVFGRVAPKKNIEYLIELMPLLDKHIVLQIHGININRKYNKKLLIKIDSLKLSNRVKFFGDYNNNDFINNWVDKIDLIAIPSYSENFCHVFFEAISAGKLVIASNGLPWSDVNAYVSNTILPLEKDIWLNRINFISKMELTEYYDEQRRLKIFYKKIQQNVDKEILENFKKLLSQN